MNAAYSILERFKSSPVWITVGHVTKDMRFWVYSATQEMAMDLKRLSSTRDPQCIA